MRILVGVVLTVNGIGNSHLRRLFRHCVVNVFPPVVLVASLELRLVAHLGSISLPAMDVVSYLAVG